MLECFADDDDITQGLLAGKIKKLLVEQHGAASASKSSYHEAKNEYYIMLVPAFIA